METRTDEFEQQFLRGAKSVCASCIFEEIRFKRHGERMQAWYLTNRIDVLRVGRGMGILWMKLGLINQSTFIYRFSKNFETGIRFFLLDFVICLLEFFLYIVEYFLLHFCKVVRGWTFMMWIINLCVLMRFGTRSNFFWFEKYLKFMSKS